MPSNIAKIRRAAGVFVALTALGGLALTAAPAEGATTGLAVSGPQIGVQAEDASDYAIVDLPSVEPQGKTKVDSVSTDVYKGKKRVAHGGNYDEAELKIGTYKVKTTIKSRTYTEKAETKLVKTAVKVKVRDPYYEWTNEDAWAAASGPIFSQCERTGDVQTDDSDRWNWPLSPSPRHARSARWMETRRRAGGLADITVITRTGSEEGARNAIHRVLQVFPTVNSYEWIDSNDASFLSPSAAWGDWYAYTTTRWQKKHPATYETQYKWVNKPTGRTFRSYGKTRVTTRTWTVNVRNSGHMTYGEYRRIKDGQSVGTVANIVGSGGRVISRSGGSGHEYTIREWQDPDGNAHWVYFDNGHVWFKMWQ